MLNKLLSKINRNGIENLTDWLLKSDFTTAPASTKYHDSREGGLLKHSLQVYENLKKINADYNLNIPEETIIICGLFHDICKVNFYKTEKRWRKDANNAWDQYDTYAIEDKFPMMHGPKSVYILNEFIHLTVEESMAIHWHMGFSGSDGYADRQALSLATEKYPIVLALQMADMMAAAWGDKLKGE